ncbi:hypothetical protein [Aurantiacibacter luteus]|uniref:hypothetical protein n=1 Tax=Aurantiacibacter luteus TaxID=1581420 RepID=UPI00069C28ED|nr:hypothetical protein [Aurantiacibacter luteus]
MLATSLACALAACGDGTTADQPDAEAVTAAGTAGTAAADAAPAAQSEDALVPGTEYNATTILDCSFDGVAVGEGCNAGVVRNWGEDGKHLVEVTKPDGTKRAIFYDGTTPTGADSAEADGSAGWDFDATRDGDTVTIVFGPETYVVPDAVITGG